MSPITIHPHWAVGLAMAQKLAESGLAAGFQALGRQQVGVVDEQVNGLNLAKRII